MPPDLAIRVKKYYAHYYTRRTAFEEVGILALVVFSQKEFLVGCKI